MADNITENDFWGTQKPYVLALGLLLCPVVIKKEL
jgi:hypothetical protein